MAFRRAAGVAVTVDTVDTVDTVSITIMEVVDNLVTLGVPDAMDDSSAHFLFWGSLAGSPIIAGALAYPAYR
jgi:hypothetical protein